MYLLRDWGDMRRYTLLMGSDADRVMDHGVSTDVICSSVNRVRTTFDCTYDADIIPSPYIVLVGTVYCYCMDLIEVVHFIICVVIDGFV